MAGVEHDRSDNSAKLTIMETPSERSARLSALAEVTEQAQQQLGMRPEQVSSLLNTTSAEDVDRQIAGQYAEGYANSVSVFKEEIDRLAEQRTLTEDPAEVSRIDGEIRTSLKAMEALYAKQDDAEIRARGIDSGSSSMTAEQLEEARRQVADKTVQ